MHAWGADRDGVHGPRGVGRAGRGRAAPVGAARDVDRPVDGRRRRGRRARALAHLVRQPRGAPGQAHLRHPARRDGALARAAAPVEGRAARRRLRAVELVRADRARGRRRGDRGLGGDEARRARGLPGARSRRASQVIYNGIDAEQYAPDTGTDVLERWGVDPIAPSVVFVGRITRQKGVPLLVEAALDIDPAAQIVLCAGAPDTPEIAEEVRGGVERLRAERGGVIWIEEMLPKADVIQLLIARDGVRLPVDLRAARDRQPRGDGVRDGRRGYRRRRDRRGRRRRRDRPAGAAGHRARDAGAARSRGLRARASPRPSTRWCAIPTAPAAMGRAGRARAVEHFAWPAIAEQTSALYRSL